MGSFARALRAIDTGIHKALLVIAQIALLVMIIIVCGTVFARYVLNTGIVWAEEVPRTMVALFAFIACAMGVRDHLHIGIEFLYRRTKAGGRARKAMDALFYILTFACGAIMAFYGWNLCVQLWRFKMPATEWPRSVQYVSMPLAGAVIMYDSLLFLFGVIKPEERIYSEKEAELEVIHIKRDKKAVPGKGA
jgi:TRAP-type C4-dicarboxylate transport system permease small subunit